MKITVEDVASFLEGVAALDRNVAEPLTMPLGPVAMLVADGVEGLLVEAASLIRAHGVSSGPITPWKDVADDVAAIDAAADAAAAGKATKP